MLWACIALRKPYGSLGRTAQDSHLDSHTAPQRTMLNQHKLVIVICRHLRPIARTSTLQHNYPCDLMNMKETFFLINEWTTAGEADKIDGTDLGKNTLALSTP